ncbi:hypothetical protein HDU76_013369 [Blyttiomyces sp. JEL0837]|nr:hypothetical protein HDU76_013369 [Blyttiomyces sp. JEL0837]
MKSAFTTILVTLIGAVAPLAQGVLSPPTIGIQMSVGKYAAPATVDKCLDRARDFYRNAIVSAPPTLAFIDCDPYCRFTEYADNSNPYTGIAYQQCS